MKILVVDDSRAIRAIVLRTLRQAGYGSHTMLEAASAGEALKAMEDSTPDLVLCDWNMPGMSGIELLNEMKARKMNIPFGFVTIESSAEAQSRALRAGAKFYILKPFTPETFQQSLGVFIER
jgi:two-component system chemotaxis response regulator CheY